MSYMRGANYIWSDGSRFHLWIFDGGDDWLGGWGPGGTVTGRSGVNRSAAGGVSITEEVMDEFVVMRFAELILAGTTADIMLRAVARYAGNFGCSSLLDSASWLLPCIQAMQSPDVSR